MERVLVDPERKLMLDVTRSNNSWVAHPSLAAGLAWPGRWVLWIQLLLEVFAFFG